MNKSSTNNNSNKSRSSPSTKVTKKRRQRSRKSKTIGGFPVSSVPVAYVSTRNMSAPRMHTQGKNLIIGRTELVDASMQFVVAGSVFDVFKRLRLNPGSQGTFPWLSGVAKNYESYRFKKLRFTFITRCSTSSEGTLYLSPDYDAADAQPTSEVVLANNSDTKESPVYRNVTVVLNPEKMNRLYKAHSVMDDARFAGTSQDVKTLDVGQLFIAGEFNFNPQKLGKLMVEYEVELYEPQQPFIPASQGGASIVLPKTVINAGVANVFQSQPTAGTLTQTENLQNILAYLPTSSYPGPNLAKFLRDFEGWVTTNQYNDGGGVITGNPDLLLNNSPVGNTWYSGTGTLSAMATSFINAKAGDVLGIQPITSSLSNPFLNIMLGGTGGLH